MERISRRGFAKVAFFGSLGAVAVAGGAALANMLYPRDPTGGNEVVVPRDRVPAAGDPPMYVAEGGFLLVHLKQGEGYDAEPGASPGGLIALSERCTHLQCEVQWRTDYRRSDEGSPEVMVCNCHGGFFTKAGVRVFGPPPRSLDTMALRVTPSGDVVVDRFDVRQGDISNPSRAVAWPPS